jgi:hypothetical protein
MSQRASGRERIEADRYFTPHWCTEALLPHLPERLGTVWEPAAGTRKMVDVLARRFIVSATDIATGHDFLQMSDDNGAQAIITNPPYTLATEFCEHALRLMEPVGGIVAMLLRTDFDHAKGRAHLFRDCPAFAKKLVLTKRIVWFEPEPGKKGKSPSKMPKGKC